MNEYSKNSHYDAWYEAIQVIQNIPIDAQFERDGLFSPATTGGLALAASYTLAGGLMMTKHPVAMATAGVILAIPDPVIFAIGAGLA